jgi:hypothetical protein
MDNQSISKDLIEFIFGTEEESNRFADYQDPRFPILKTQQIKSLFIELKEDKWKYCWKNNISSKLAFSLGNFEHYLTQGYQKHIHNITKKFVNIQDDKETFYVSTGVLLTPLNEKKFCVDEHRENQYKVLTHIHENGATLLWKEFFDLMDEARKCNVVTVPENTRLQEFQLKSLIGDWRNDYKKANVELLNMCNSDEIIKYINESDNPEIVIGNIERLRKRNFSGTKEILNALISIINTNKR